MNYAQLCINFTVQLIVAEEVGKSVCEVRLCQTPSTETDCF